MPTSAPLSVQTHEHIVTLELSAPERRNALSRELVTALADALEAAAANAELRVIILQGSGGSFCAGADLSAIGGVPAGELPQRIDEFHRIIVGITEAPQPVIASIDGAAVGFGADVALACDIRLMSEQAYLQESFVNIGLMPDGGGTHWAPHYFGARAFELLALGRKLSAQQCHDVQLTAAPLPPADLPSAAQALAQELASKPPLALAQIKAALSAGRRTALREALGREREGQTRLLQSADFQEGVTAFLEKRRPQFRGE